MENIHTRVRDFDTQTKIKKSLLIIIDFPACRDYKSPPARFSRLIPLLVTIPDALTREGKA